MGVVYTDCGIGDGRRRKSFVRDWWWTDESNPVLRRPRRERVLEVRCQ